MLGERLKDLGSYLLGLFFIVVLGLIIGAVLNGLVWLVDKLYPFALGLAVLGTAALVLLLLPSAVFRSNRIWCGKGIYYVSYAWGISLWMWATLVLYSLWGTFGLFLGLILLGVGSVPVACVALLFAGEFRPLGQMILAVILVFAVRFFGLWLITKGMSDSEIEEDFYA